MAGFTFAETLPKVRSGRSYERTDADDGLDALDKQPAGKALTLAVSDGEAADGLRRRYIAAARARGRKVATRQVDGKLYIAYRP